MRAGRLVPAPLAIAGSEDPAYSDLPGLKTRPGFTKAP